MIKMIPSQIFGQQIGFDHDPILLPLASGLVQAVLPEQLPEPLCVRSCHEHHSLLKNRLSKSWFRAQRLAQRGQR